MLSSSKGLSSSSNDHLQGCSEGTEALLDLKSQVKARSRNWAAEADDLRKQKANVKHIPGDLEFDFKRVSV